MLCQCLPSQAGHHPRCLPWALLPCPPPELQSGRGGWNPRCGSFVLRRSDPSEKKSGCSPFSVSLFTSCLLKQAPRLCVEYRCYFEGDIKAFFMKKLLCSIQRLSAFERREPGKLCLSRQKGVPWPSVLGTPAHPHRKGLQGPPYL